MSYVATTRTRTMTITLAAGYGSQRRSPPADLPKMNDDDHRRFQVELEFVQSLANPSYLNYLAQNGHFKDRCFINYLKYLLYWKRPEYAKFLKYPMALYFLDLLQYDDFRREISNTACTKFVEDQQLLHWQHYTRKRTRLLQPPAAAVSNGSASTNGGQMSGSANLKQQSQTQQQQPQQG